MNASRVPAHRAGGSGRSAWQRAESDDARPGPRPRLRRKPRLHKGAPFIFGLGRTGRASSEVLGGMDNRFNTIAGWVLGGGIVLLGASLVTGEIFQVRASGDNGLSDRRRGRGRRRAAARQPIRRSRHCLQTADIGAGEATFRKCTACHNATQGGPNGTGPESLGQRSAPTSPMSPAISYSDALRSHGGHWDWERSQRSG